MNIKSLFLAAIIGGAALFVWSAISWMVLPWYEITMRSFADEDSVTEVIMANTPQPGIYYLPGMPEHAPDASGEEIAAAEEKTMERWKTGPHIFASVRHTGTESMTPFMLRGFIFNIIGVFLVAWLISKTKNPGYWGKAVMCAVFGLAAAVAIHFSYWNWWSFSTAYTLVSTIDMVIGWFIVGMVVAKFVPGKTEIDVKVE